MVLNAVFCFACRHFPQSDKAAKHTFTVGDFQNWKKAHYSDREFSLHAKAPFHINAMIAWCEYKKLKASSRGNVCQMQTEAFIKQVKENRHYVKTIAK